MTQRPHSSLARAIEASLAPGTFIGDWHHSGFVDGLETVRARIAPLIGRKQDASGAVDLLEIFIAGCYEKSDEIDDSSGSFGAFVRSLFCDWIRARQTARAEPGETVRMLLSWVENDDYGYARDLDKEAVRVLDRAGLGALERAVRSRPVEGGCGGRESCAHRRKIELLKAIHERRRDVEAYAGLCVEEGNVAPGDCESLARMCLARRRLEDALAWAQRGLDLAKERAWHRGSAWQLGQLHREILKALGRHEEALGSTWEEYRRAPSTASYRDLMRFVRRSERPEWHERVLAVLAGAGLRDRIDLLLSTRESARLANLIGETPRAQLVNLSHYTTEPAARRLKRSHPRLSAKVHAAMALRILEAKKSRYYEAALTDLATARRLLLGTGHTSEWESLVGEVRAAHWRKTGFMPGFERIVGGRSSREPSFRVRARRRWCRVVHAR